MQTYCMISFIWHSQKTKPYQQKSKSVVSRDQRRRSATENEGTEKKKRKWGNCSVLIMMIAQLCIITKFYKTVHLKMGEV